MVKVAQCWDDGPTTDVRLVELLKKYNAKATFNLCPGQLREERSGPSWYNREENANVWNHKGFCAGRVGRNEMYDLYKDFCVASHCWNHQTIGYNPEDEIVKAAIDARKFLEDMFQKECNGFAWPCGRFSDYLVEKLTENGFKYGRTTRKAKIVEDYEHPMLLDASCHFQDIEFFDLFEQAKARNGIFYFWGHSYEMMDSEGMWGQLELKLKILSEDPDVEWIDVIDIVK